MPLEMVPAAVARQREAMNPSQRPAPSVAAASQPLTAAEAAMDVADLVNLKARLRL